MGNGGALRHAILLSRRRFLQNVSLLAGAWPFIKVPLLKASPASSYAFEEVPPSSSGIKWVHTAGKSPEKYLPETSGAGCAFLDYDKDGWMDIYLVNSGKCDFYNPPNPIRNALYRNNREGTFTDVTEKAGVGGGGYGMGVAVGDYDNDGHEDMFVLGVYGNQLFHNNGDGTFSDVTEAAGLKVLKERRIWSIAAAWIDYDGDGKLDLFVSNYCDWAAGLDPVCGGMTPDLRRYCHPDKYHSQAMQLFHNNGDGTFTDVTGKKPLAVALGKGMGIAIADFAGDGRPGLFVANDNARNLLFRNSGQGFEEIGIDAGVAYNGDGRSISGMGADFGDITGNGRFDVVMTALKNESFGVFLNRGHGNFEDVSEKTGLMGLTHSVSGWGCGLVDLDNDGWLDFFVAGGGVDAGDGMTNKIYRNSGGKFTDVSNESGVGRSAARLHRGCALADFDHDGRLDVAVTSMDGPIELWWNRSPAQHWLQLRLVGTRSNRSAIGAEVTCKTTRSE